MKNQKKKNNPPLPEHGMPCLPSNEQIELRDLRTAVRLLAKSIVAKDTDSLFRAAQIAIKLTSDAEGSDAG